MNDQTDVLAAQLREEEVRRREEAQEADRRRLQQIIHDDERHALEQKARRGGPALAAQTAGAVAPQSTQTVAKAGDKLGKASAGEKPQTTAASNPGAAPGIGVAATVVLALVIAVSCFLGWKAFQHWKPSTAAGAKVAVAQATDPLPMASVSPASDSRDKVASIDPPMPPAAAPESAQSPATAPAPSPAPPAGTPEPKPKPEQPTGDRDALASPTEKHAAPESTGAGDSANGDRAGLPDPTPRANATPVPASESTVTPAAAPVAAAEANPTPTSKQEPTNSEISARLDRLEAMLTEIRDRVAAKPVVVAATAPVAAATPEKAPREKSAPTLRKAAPVKAVPAIRNGQLLAVDMWNGVPSIVIGTGLPDDKRVRVLKRGDVYNGVALLNVDPVARTATFGLGNGRSFTLSVNQGG